MSSLKYSDEQAISVHKPSNAGEAAYSGKVHNDDKDYIW